MLHQLRLAAALGVALSLAAAAPRHDVRPASLQALASPIVRFHHAHYRVGDPATAMTDALRAVDGVRVIAQGLGVGIRTGEELLLFDRLDEEGAGTTRSAAEAFAVAVDRLKGWGLQVQPSVASQVRATMVFPDLPVDHLAFTADAFDALVRHLLDAGAPVLAKSEDAILFDGGGARIEIVRDTDREETHWCPMHPDVRSADPGKCPLCAMDLVPIPPPKLGEYGLDVEVDRHPRSATIRRLRFTVREPDTNAPVTDLQVVHERAFHLFMISRDLEFFDHVHPERQADGSYVLDTSLPAGEYMLIADFLPAGGTTQMVQRAVISGRRGAARRATPGPGTRLRTVEAGGLRVSLDAGPMAAGKEVLLSFSVADAKTGEPVTDLEPYLGAPAHMLIVRTDLADAIHAHPEEVATGGPTVSFHPLVPSEGDYRLWIQFQRAGRVITVPFALRTEK